MDSYQIEQIINKGEGINVEFKLAEELGMGIRKIFKYCKLYTNQEPQINDKDWFEVYIPIITSKVVLNSFSVGISTTPKGSKSTTPKKLEDTTPKVLKDTTQRNLNDAILKELGYTTQRKVDKTTQRNLQDTTQKEPKSTTPKKLEDTTPKSLDNATKNIGKEIRGTIIKLLAADPYLSASKIGEKLNISRDGVRYHLQHLKKAKQIRFVDKPQNGFWEIKK